MDDSCAVCAESLEWVAYGACGHRDVCSTCVARLRFVCDDRRCCICKSESDVVFVTKAMGDYTRVINDFAVLPAQGREGRVGAYWYHEGVQAFFDDVDHYKMIKAMCRLSCGVCDKMDGQQQQQQQQPNNGGKRPLRFRNIEQLKGHLFHRHKLFMCSLCLEGRKIFICEQKLYTRAQLNRHVSTGDSEVDGSESERGGFAGHPKCEFCRTPFYGDNELYTHMSTEHFTCHICQRQHPGQYEYYKNYDDLEMHFRGDHFLCEDEACLEKKFIVFQSEAELKRHNTMEHGGRMSRSKRNAALQIPTSFRYRRSNEQDRHRGRRQTFRPDFSDDQLSMAIEASLETANADGRAHDPAAPPSNSGTQATGGDAESIDTLIQPFDSLATSNTESSARYLQALGHSSRKAPMEESSFPPLPLVSSSSQQKSNYDSEGYPSGSMADRLRRKNKVSIVNASRASPVTNNGPAMPVGNSAHSWPTPSTASCVVNAGPSGGPSNSAQYSAESAVPHGPSDGPSRIWGNSRINHSASSPNIIAGTGSSTVSMSDFPPVAATQVRKVASSQSLPVVQDVQTANKSLVEKIRESLGYDEDKYSTFKVISAEYRQGSIDTQSYLAYVWQFGLWHLVLDLARLCPDNEKQKELVDTYNASLGSTAPQQNDWGSEQLKSNQRSRKGKGKVLNVRENNSKDALADSIISTVRKLQSSYNPADEQTEELSKDGYRATKGKAKLSEEQPLKLGSDSLLLAKSSDRDAVSSSAAGGSSQSSGAGGGSSKQRKKTSKFHRVRLGDGSVAAFLDLQSSNAGSASDGLDEMQAGNKVPTGGLPVRGAWQTGGSHKLFS